MATIQNGYGDEVLSITFDTHTGGSTTIGLNIDQFDGWKYSETQISDDQPKSLFRAETLAYMTLTEAIELRNELNTAIKEVAGL